MAEWQTLRTQNALSERACGFESHHRYRLKEAARTGLARANRPQPAGMGVGVAVGVGVAFAATASASEKIATGTYWCTTCVM